MSIITSESHEQQAEYANKMQQLLAKGLLTLQDISDILIISNQEQMRLQLEAQQKINKASLKL